MSVIGLDLALATTGWALVDVHGQQVCGQIVTNEADALEPRLAHIEDGIANLVLNNRPTLIVIEDQAPGKLNRKVTHIPEVHGIVRKLLWASHQRFLLVTPGQIKKLATGKGTAAKPEVLGAAIRRLGYAGNSFDEADALWAAHLGWHALWSPKVELPQLHRDALKAVKLG